MALPRAGAWKYPDFSDAVSGSEARYWLEPHHGLATRVPALKQAKTARGHTIFNDILVYHESELEHRVSLIIQARPDVLEVHSQYPVVRYQDEDGTWHKHTFDYYVVFKNGVRLAVAVKYARKKAMMLDLLDRIRVAGVSHHGKGHGRGQAADNVCLMTEHDATFELADNARSILAARDTFDEADVALLKGSLAQLPGSIRFAELLIASDDRAKRRASIWRLIELGVLQPTDRSRIDELTMLRVNSAAAIPTTV